MRNYTKTKSLKKPRAKPEEMAVVRQGYLDALSGKGFRPAYETFPRWRQNNYEIGRLVAVEMGSSRAPSWPISTILPRWMESMALQIVRELRPMGD